MVREHTTEHHMQIPTTYFSLHDVTALKAAALTTLDTPLVLSIETPHGGMQISLYLNDVEASKIERIASAINLILHEPAAPKIACPVEAAAYKSADDYWAALKRDLDRHPIGKAAE
jgi:hypothetical protein